MSAERKKADRGTGARGAARTEELAAVNAALEAEVATRKRFEDELRASQRFLGATLGALPSRIAVLDGKGNVIAVNTAWERFRGSDPLVPPAIGLGADFLASCDAAAREGSNDARTVGEGIRDLLAGRRRTFSLEYPDRQGEGWYLLRMTYFEIGPPDAGSAPARLVLQLEDISQRKQAEEALVQAMTRTQLMTDSAVDGIITIDETGRIESFNPAAEEMFGYAAAEVIGGNVSLLMPSPFREEHDRYIEGYLETGRKKIIGIGREVVGRRRDGTVFPMDLAVAEMVFGDRRFFLGSVRDITERKAMEEALRRERDFAESLVETAQTIVLVLDCDGRIVRFNRYLEQISGHLLEDVRGESWFEIFLPPGDQPRVRGVFSRALGDRSTSGTINPIVTKDGAVRQIEWHNTTLSDPDGNVIGVLATGQDITERRELEEQFLQAQKMEAVGRLAGGVAHDFNTLLGSITGYSEMLLERLGEDDPLRRPLEQIHRGAERGAGLTRQLLAFSRRQVLQPRVLDLNAAIRDMDGLLRQLIRPDVELRYELGAELGAVEVDPGQIEQVIMNLVVNAVDAVSQGGRITVATENAELDEAHGERDAVLVAGSYVVLAVSDDGCGMDEAVKSRIFEPFFTTKEPGKGTGLGLSTAYGIVRQSGGGISVESEPGRGSTFRVYLLRSAGTPEAAAAKPVAAGSRPGSETVLLVEDDEMFLGLLAEVLEGHGYKVLPASGPEEALAACNGDAGRVDLLISDMVMPGMTGAELAKQLLDKHPAMKVILMSGYTDEAVDDRGVLEVGGVFLQKPFSTKEFTHTVREVLDRG
jgi:PAS domain S-box-containing protein